VLQLNPQHFKQHVGKDHTELVGHSNTSKLFLDDEATNFEKLYPEETKKRLGKIVNRIDVDQNGLVSAEELTNWIDYIHKNHIKKDVQREWISRNPDKTEKISWSRYKQNVYGFLNDKSSNIPKTSLQDMIDRDKRRWDMADANSDGSLDIEEFKAFLHPEADERMSEVVLTEIIEDMDLDNDGHINLDEYIRDILDEEDLEPGLKEREITNFKDNLDLNKDGVMDRQEVKDWILPVQYDFARGEADYLITVSDKNEDKQLALHEILDNYKVFIGSQATDYGKGITRHEEL